MTNSTNTLDRDRLAPATGTAPAPRARQLRALAGAEWRELLRNKVALMNCFGLPPALGLIALGMESELLPIGVFFPVMITGTAILFVVYYTLVTAVVARREALQLKRLRSGEADDATILAGIVCPFAGVTLAQFVIAAVLARFLFDTSLSALTLVSVLGVALATVTFATLGIASASFTRTVEHAQITTLPIIMIPLLLSGMAFPLPFMPDAMRTVAELMPLTPVVELIYLGLGLMTVDGAAVTLTQGVGEAVRPLLVLLAWTAIGVALIKRSMVWEPRS